jgi:hypothetical protein
MAFARNRLVARRRDGRFTLRLPDEVRQALGQLLGELRELLSTEQPGDERLRRLFPPAYSDDLEANAEYQRFMREELVTSRLSAIDQVAETLAAKELTEAQLMAWMTSVNSVRLVVGTLLDVQEDDDLSRLDPEDPSFGGYLLYGELSYVLEHIVAALAEAG